MSDVVALLAEKGEQIAALQDAELAWNDREPEPKS